MSQSESAIIIEIDGLRFQWKPGDWKNLDCIETGHNEFHLIENGLSHWITVMEFDLESRTCLLKVDGEIKRVRFPRDLDLMIERMGLNVVQQKKLKTLEAPMPGLVTGIKMGVGDEVPKGTPLLILEAMKMENVIIAPQDAKVKSIAVKVGDAVEKGQTLVEFE